VSAVKMTREQVAREQSFWTVLQQRKWWRTGDGRAIRRREMNVQYQLNALAYLIRKAPEIVGSYVNSWVFATCPDDVEAELDRMMADPERAIIETPMAQALLSDIMSFADIGPEDLGMERVNRDGLTELANVVHTYGPTRAERAMTDSLWLSRGKR
jgi:hypothetical protein